MRKLTIFIPGLFGPKSKALIPVTVDAPALEKVLTFATAKNLAVAGFINNLFRIFGFSATQRDYPVAAITRLVDDEHDTAGIWMRADPVSLRAEREAVILVDDSAFELNRHEAIVLAADLQQAFADYDIELQAPTNNRWYLRLQNMPDLYTKSIHEVVGQDISHHLCAGKDKTLWDRIATDAQISLHNCPINVDRLQREQLPINGIWMWGCGPLPNTVATPVWTNTFSDEVTTCGLAKLTKVRHQQLPDSMSEVLNHSSPQDNILVVISSGLQHQQYYNLNGWQDFIGYLEDQWFTDVEYLLKQKELSQLTLLTEQHELTLSRMSFIKFWRKHKPLHVYTSQ